MCIPECAVFTLFVRANNIPDELGHYPDFCVFTHRKFNVCSELIKNCVTDFEPLDHERVLVRHILRPMFENHMSLLSKPRLSPELTELFAAKPASKALRGRGCVGTGQIVGKSPIRSGNLYTHLTHHLFHHLRSVSRRRASLLDLGRPSPKYLPGPSASSMDRRGCESMVTRAALELQRLRTQWVRRRHDGTL